MYALTSLTESAERSCAALTTMTLRSAKSEGVVSSARLPGCRPPGGMSRTSVSGSAAFAAATTWATARSSSSSSWPTARVSGASRSSGALFLAIAYQHPTGHGQLRPPWRMDG